MSQQPDTAPETTTTNTSATIGPTSDPEAGLEVRAVGKSYGGVPALAGVDLTVRPGEVHGLLGPNGAGKTTLLSMVLGLTLPATGTITVSGAPVGHAVAAAATAGFLEPAFWPYLSGRANLRVLARLDGRSRRDASTRVDAELRRVGLTDRADATVGGWSLGMRQRLAIAAALLREPRLLVLDEPTNGLDPQSLQVFRDLVRELAGQGVAVLLSSHAIAEVAALADRVTILAAGRVAFDGSVPELVAVAPDPRYRLRTSDDRTAARLAADDPGVGVTDDVGNRVAGDDDGLLLTAGQLDLDAFVLRLGAAGIAVRRLDVATNPLEALFSSLTEENRT